jgi:CubicO group peptidase (beta-lactamase class C family)
MQRLSMVGLVLVLLTTAVAFWVVEPYGNNPMVKPPLQTIELTHSPKCDFQSNGLEKKVRERFSEHLEEGQLLGASIGFYTPECGTYVAAGGVSSKRGLKPFSPNTVTRIASLTKPMTAIAVMQLHEAGMLDIDETIQHYLKDFPKTAKPVTIRHLLNHTSGIPHYKSFLDAMSFSSYENLQTATEAVYARGFAANAGDRYIYTSFGYTLLGRIVEVVTGQDFATYLEKELWQPSGMFDTSLESAVYPAGKSRLYLKIPGMFVRGPYTDLSLIYPAGGVQSTAQDLLSFGAAVDDAYGLGWSVTEHPDFGTIIAHGGSQPGVSAQFLVLLDQDIVAVALSNAYGTKGSVIDLAYFMANQAFLSESR